MNNFLYSFVVAQRRRDPYNSLSNFGLANFFVCLPANSSSAHTNKHKARAGLTVSLANRFAQLQWRTAGM